MSHSILEKERDQLLALLVKFPILANRFSEESRSDYFNGVERWIAEAAIKQSTRDGSSLSRKSFMDFVSKIQPLPKKTEQALAETTYSKIAFAPANVNDYSYLSDNLRNDYLRRNQAKTLKTIKDALIKAYDGTISQPALLSICENSLGQPQARKPKAPMTNSKELLSNSAVNESEPIIHGILRKGEICNIIAASKARKSWLVHDLAISLETGSEWLGFSCDKSKVLLIDNELHIGTLKNRLSKVYAAKEASPTGSLDIIAGRGKGLTLKDIPDLIKDIKCDVIILDALYRFYEPGFLENDNAEMTQLYNSLDQIAMANNVSIIMVHHATKGSQTNKAVTDVGSGAGAMSRATDSQITIRSNKDASKDDVAYLDFVTRSFQPVERIAIRWNSPRWIRTDVAAIPYEEVKSDMDEYDFAKRYFTNTWVAKVIILDNAIKDGMSSATFTRRLSVATEKKMVEYQFKDGNARNGKEFSSNLTRLMTWFFRLKSRLIINQPLYSID